MTNNEGVPLNQNPNATLGIEHSILIFQDLNRPIGEYASSNMYNFNLGDVKRWADTIDVGEITTWENQLIEKFMKKFFLPVQRGLGQLQQGQQTCHYGGGRSEAHGYHHGHHNAMPHYSHPQQNQANIASSSSPMENIVKEHI
ncbi:hypothetical protein E5676_scaffold799G00120 [Cucumis melo var. makuwa]|uniref:Uncharacterized protein n=1 Tax=Cucumis melo var. makuwa TaxID=1194695 RepID=A0A5D3E433_CUCMM|nr:hypothetical protein E6C27_scaffold81G00120 [Cucumis melo var. makuwa]TYK30568.1 hypothetical protein E5676_scaffold799G00120 [Cucumis melo var. makuwa]